MGPLEIAAALLLFSRGGKAGGWRQLCPNSKGQYAVSAGQLFAVDVDASSPVAPLLTKQVQDLGGQVLPPTAAVSSLPVDWPSDDETRTSPGRMRGAAKTPRAIAIDMGTSPRPTRVWVK